MDHPHIHCIVPGGGLSLDGKRWISCKRRFFIRVDVLSRLFRGKFLYYFKKAYGSGQLEFPGKIRDIKPKTAFKKTLTELYRRDWVVYCKAPLKNAETVIDYLGRYTHRVAISNDRLLTLAGGQVAFKYRDFADDDKVMVMSLDAFEFIGRFLLHILPEGFMKIRYYGILSNRNKRTKLARCRQLLGAEVEHDDEQAENESWEDLFERVTGIDPRICPHCGKGEMVFKEILLPAFSRPPP
jgi:hypothetical protein